MNNKKQSYNKQTKYKKINIDHSEIIHIYIGYYTYCTLKLNIKCIFLLINFVFVFSVWF